MIFLIQAKEKNMKKAKPVLTMIAMLCVGVLVNVNAGQVSFTEWTVKGMQGVTSTTHTKNTNTGATSVKQKKVGEVDIIKWETLASNACISDTLLATEDDNWHTANYWAPEFWPKGTKVTHKYSSYKWNLGSYVMSGVLNYY